MCTWYECVCTAVHRSVCTAACNIAVLSRAGHSVCWTKHILLLIVLWFALLRLTSTDWNKEPSFEQIAVVLIFEMNVWSGVFVTVWLYSGGYSRPHLPHSPHTVSDIDDTWSSYDAGRIHIWLDTCIHHIWGEHCMTMCIVVLISSVFIRRRAVITLSCPREVVIMCEVK